MINPSTRKRLEVEVQNCKDIAREEQLAARRRDITDLNAIAHEKTAEYYTGMAAGIGWTLWAIDAEEAIK